MDSLQDRFPKHLHKLIPGAVLVEKGALLFRCPVCGNTTRSDDQYEPCCTGPNSTHDHEMTVMVAQGADDSDVHKRIWLPT